MHLFLLLKFQKCNIDDAEPGNLGHCTQNVLSRCLFRMRYPFFDQQTGTAHRFNPVFYRFPSQRASSTDPNTVIHYTTQRWRRRQSTNSSDAIEMKMFLRDNPALDAALTTTASAPQPGEFTRPSNFLRPFVRSMFPSNL